MSAADNTAAANVTFKCFFTDESSYVLFRYLNFVFILEQMLAGHDELLAFLETGKHFLIRVLQTSELDLPLLGLIAVHDKDVRIAAFAHDAKRRNSDDVLIRLLRQQHLRL